MALLQQSEEYSLLSPDEHSETGFEKSPEFPNRQQKSSPLKYIFYLCFGLSLLALGISIGVLIKSDGVLSSGPGVPAKFVSGCITPSTRREWRSLSTAEKHDYLQAVGCLREQPSRLGLNQSLYDDFPWVHVRIGEYCKFALKSGMG